MVRSTLQQHPHFEVVGEAENGAEAIEEVKRVRPDVVVLNVTMPLVNGFQAAREIKKQIPETAIGRGVIKAAYLKVERILNVSAQTRALVADLRIDERTDLRFFRTERKLR